GAAVAIPGPTIRAALKIAESSEMAFSRLSLPVNRMMSHWGAGISTRRWFRARRREAGRATRLPGWKAPTRPNHRLEHGQALCQDDFVPGVRRETAERSQGQTPDPHAELRGAPQQFGMREAVDPPALWHILHPRAHQGDNLAGNEQPEIPVPTCPSSLRQAAAQIFERNAGGRGQ